MNKRKKIFESNTPLTKEEIKAYLDGKLSQPEKYKFEQKTAANEFNSDAMEGFEEVSGAMAGFENLENKFHSSLPRKSSNGFWKFEFSVLLIVGMAVGIYLAGYHFLDQASIEKEKFDKKVVEKKQSEVKNSNIETTTPAIIELNDDEIEAAIPLEKNKQLTSQRIIIDAPLVVDSSSIYDKTSKIDSTIVQNKKEKEKVNLELIDRKEIPVIDKTNLVYSNIKTLFLSKLLVVDYSDIYTENISLPNFELTGTPANKENKQDTGTNDLEITSFTKEITYVNFLEMTQVKFRKNKFKDALKDYRTILNQYPNDVNAHFYMALCYYNINKQKKAILHFDRVLKHEFNTFHEEAKWYKALSLYEMRKTSKCITILNQIANANGFYADKAKNMLNDI